MNIRLKDIIEKIDITDEEKSNLLALVRTMQKEFEEEYRKTRNAELIDNLKKSERFKDFDFPEPYYPDGYWDEVKKKLIENKKR